MNRRNLLIRAAGLAAVAGAAWWARDNLIWPKPDLTFGDGHATPWTPYARRANVPTIRATIEGRDVIALIDTGAQYSAVDRAFVASLGERQRSMFDMPMLAYGVGGGSQVGRGTTLDVDLPGLQIAGLRAAILDLGPLAAEEGLATPLILGRDVLEHLILALDADRRHVRLITPDAFIPPEDMIEAPVVRNGNALSAEVTIEGNALQAVIDTGSSALLSVSQRSAAGVGLLDGRPRESGISLVLGGAMRADTVEARTVTFADQLYHRVQIGVFEQPPLPNFPDGLVGMEAFAGRRAALDLGAGRLLISRQLDLTVG